MQFGTYDLTKVKLILMDIDGTLVLGSETELDNVRRQLARLEHRAILYSVATGRTIFGARRILSGLDPRHRVQWIVAYNGGVVARPDATPWIDREVLDSRSFFRLLDLCRRLRLAPLVYTCRNHFDLECPETVFAESHFFATQETEFNGMPINRIPDLEKVPAQDVVAVLVSDPSGSGTVEELAELVRNELGVSLRITTSGGSYAEIAHPNSSKRNAMRKLCERLGISAGEVMAIGDNLNDLEMLAESGCSVAVANSPQSVKDVSRFVCRHEAAGGVVEVLRTVAEAHRFKSRCRQVGQED